MAAGSVSYRMHWTGLILRDDSSSLVLVTQTIADWLSIALI